MKAEIEGGEIVYTIEKELGVELVGDIKVKIEASEEDDNWDDIVEDNSLDNDDINSVKEDFINEETI